MKKKANLHAKSGFTSIKRNLYHCHYTIFHHWSLKCFAIFFLPFNPTLLYNNSVQCVVHWFICIGEKKLFIFNSFKFFNMHQSWLVKVVQYFVFFFISNEIQGFIQSCWFEWTLNRCLWVSFHNWTSYNFPTRTRRKVVCTGLFSWFFSLHGGQTNKKEKYKKIRYEDSCKWLNKIELICSIFPFLIETSWVWCPLSQINVWKIIAGHKCISRR